jgi:3-hydroxyacyl-CoA dehydrogenase
MSSPGSGSQTIETIAVIGAGTMGHGIAQVAAAAGFKVLLNAGAGSCSDRDQPCQGNSARKVD